MWIDVDLTTGDVTRADGRVLLAGLGPLVAADRAGEHTWLLRTPAGPAWLLRVSPASGLVTALEPVAIGNPAGLVTALEPVAIGNPAADELVSADASP
jgi:hypothetical protein